MSQIQISSTGWLAILLRNGIAGVFDLNDVRSRQHLETQSIVKQSTDVNTNNIHRNLIKFSSNGEILVFNGHNRQVNVYRKSNFEETEVFWELQRIVLVKDSITIFELTYEILLIADISGDIYRIDLTDKNKNKDLIISAENCIMKNESMLLDMLFIRINEEKLSLITADQDEQIRLSHFPNTSKIDGYCLGHTEFVSHIKLIDNNHILSASGDGTIRLWRLPNCVPLVLLHSKAFVLLSKQVFYSQLYDSSSYRYLENYHNELMPHESAIDSSSIQGYSIWKMDVACYEPNIYLAFSIYAHRSHSIYLTSLENIKKLSNKQCKLTFDISYGTIIDYCFPSKDNLYDDPTTNLYILFDSNIILKVDIISVLLCNENELFAETNETIQEINNILTQKEFYIIDSMNNYMELDEYIFKQLSKNIKNSNENSSQKRKIERFEQNQRKKQASSQDVDEHNSLLEYF